MLDGLTVEPLALDNRIHMALGHIKVPQHVTTMTSRFFIYLSYPMPDEGVEQRCFHPRMPHGGHLCMSSEKRKCYSLCNLVILAMLCEMMQPS